MSFNEHLSHLIALKKSILCIGLDTSIDRIPTHLHHLEDPVFAFNKQIIDATAHLAVAFKINTAFYEALGIKGWRVLKSTLDYLPDDVIKIADAKRGDIGNTAAMYAQALFEELGADAITVNPLLGYDSVEPFIKKQEKGVFFLCLTSNPGSKDFQHFTDGQQQLYEKIALSVQSWNANKNCGLVVGATHPDELKQIRSRVPDLPFLIPGIGAQGGDIQAAVRAGTNSQGTMAIFNSSRAIIYASNDENFAHRAQEKAEQTRMALNKARTA
jgi:orotidine-5'-phosphate decarboxylase